MTTTTATSKEIPYEKKVVVKNLYMSNIAEEIIATQVDLEIPLVISILKELDVYKGQTDDENEVRLVTHRS
jgi:ferredoxin-fold anticodon binding domain-containing protein